MQVDVAAPDRRQSRDSTATMEEDVLAYGEVDIIKAIQQQLNKNRRLEARLRKLGGDMQQKHAQWGKFQKELQQTFHQERKTYLADVSALERELVDARKAKDAAMEQLLALTDKSKTSFGDGSKSRDASPAVQLTLEDKQAWDSLIAGPADMEQDQDFNDEDLRNGVMVTKGPQAFAEALLRCQQGKSDASQGAWDKLANQYGALPATPPIRRPVPYPRTPPGKPSLPSKPPDVVAQASQPPEMPYAAGQASLAIADPYLRSPGQASADVHHAGLPVVEAVPKASLPMVTGRTCGRIAVKPATMTRQSDKPHAQPRTPPAHGPASLAEKMEQKRAAATAAMVIPSTAIVRPEVHLESYVLSDDDGPEKHSQNGTHELD